MSAGAVDVNSAVKLTGKELDLLKKSPAEYRATVYDPEIPRAFVVNLHGCPVCGEKFLKHGNYGWIITEERPFKVQCPECKNIFPDNDFEQYYRTGDKKYLNGKFSDDGRGYRKPGEKQKYWFVAYYHHWMLYKHNKVVELAKAYKRTGNPEFARRLFARLDRYADVYSRYNYNKQSRYAEEVNKNYNGRMVNAIWETFSSRDIASAYRIAMDFLKNDDPVLTQVTGKTSAEIKNNIENNMLRIMANDIMTENGKNSGNFGMHQTALLEISAALNDPKMAGWVTDFRVAKNWQSTPLDYALYCNFYGDGAPLESPSYNRHWVENLRDIAQYLAVNNIDIKKRHRHYQRILDYAENLSVCCKFQPSSGDTGSVRSSGGALKKDPKDPLKGFRSSLLPGYGTASLQNERPDAPAAFWMSYGAYIGHKHSDGMHVELFAGDVPLSPDFGYPESASSDDPVRHAWFDNTLSHNTVVVNASKQRAEPGTLLHYDTGAFAQRIEVDAPKVYQGMKEFRRTDIVCEPFPGKLVVLDIFRVKGGKQHDWFFHGANEVSVAAGVEFVPQEGGTLAGKDVEFGFYYDDKKLRGKVSNYGSYRGSGFQFLTNVQSAAGKSGASVAFPVRKGRGFTPKYENTALKIHAVNGDGEKWFLSQGPTQRNHKNVPKHLAFFTRRTTGDVPLESMFVSVLESCSDNVPAIQKIEKLECSNDNVDILITFADNSTLRISDFDKIKDNIRSQAILKDAAGTVGASYKFSGNTFKAKIKSLNLLEEKVTFDRPVPQELAGTVFRVGLYGYKIGRIENDTVYLKEQSMIRGRFRMHKGSPSPAMPLAKKSVTYVYKADAETLLGSYPQALKNDYPDDQDLWLGECAPGNEAVFTFVSERQGTLLAK